MNPLSNQLSQLLVDLAAELPERVSRELHGSMNIAEGTPTARTTIHILVAAAHLCYAGYCAVVT
jgi:hypothetical protein